MEGHKQRIVKVFYREYSHIRIFGIKYILITHLAKMKKGEKGLTFS